MVRVVKNKELIKSFIYDDKELFDRITDDYDKTKIKTRESFMTNKVLWIGFFDKGICKALAYLSKGTQKALNVHINIPKKYRTYTAYRASKKLLEYVEKNIKSCYNKLNTQIPSIYPNVIRWAEKFGFKKYGIDKGVCLINNELCDRILMSKKIVRS